MLVRDRVQGTGYSRVMSLYLYEDHGVYRGLTTVVYVTLITILYILYCTAMFE